MVAATRGCADAMRGQISCEEIEALVNDVLDFIRNEALQGSMARGTVDKYR